MLELILLVGGLIGFIWLYTTRPLRPDIEDEFGIAERLAQFDAEIQQREAEAAQIEAQLAPPSTVDVSYRRPKRKLLT